MEVPAVINRPLQTADSIVIIFIIIVTIIIIIIIIITIIITIIIIIITIIIIIIIIIAITIIIITIIIIGSLFGRGRICRSGRVPFVHVQWSGFLACTASDWPIKWH